jgi:hypothetical protein
MSPIKITERLGTTKDGPLCITRSNTRIIGLAPDVAMSSITAPDNLLPRGVKSINLVLDLSGVVVDCDQLSGELLEFGDGSQIRLPPSGESIIILKRPGQKVSYGDITLEHVDRDQET